jgi:hypothetical protein
MQLSPTFPPSVTSVANKSPVNAPLLPPLLLGPAAYVWFWILPIGILGLLNLQGYALIEGNMSPVEKIAAHHFGWWMAANLMLGLFAWLVSLVWRAQGAIARTRHPLWEIGIIGVQVIYLWTSIVMMDTVIPSSVRSWLYPEERFLWNQFAFAMLPLFLGILRLASVRAEIGDFGKTCAIALGAAFGAPMLLYISFNILSFAPWARITPTIVAAEIVLCGLIMFIGLIRFVLFGLRAAQQRRQKTELWIIGFVGAVFPLCGLWLNVSIPFPVNLQSWEVYALVVANVGFLFWASLKREYTPRLSYTLLCFTLPFSLYFFIIFLPFTPLSILAVLALGAGFLVLSPVLLFVLQLHLLNGARKAVLRRNYGRRSIWLCSASFLVLPILYTARALADRAALHGALDYIYAPSITDSSRLTYTGSRLNLRRALSHHRDYKNGVFYPLLSPYYSWLVFDNLVLPDDKLAQLESTFFADQTANVSQAPHSRHIGLDRTVRDRTLLRPAAPFPHTAEVKSLNLESHLLAPGSHLTTLRFTLANTGASPAEYVEALPLPAGVFVKGFRLEMNGERVAGRIFERKTAAWVYSMIRDSERRDPGLLLYTDIDHLELRVFPITDHPIAVEIDLLSPNGVAKGASVTTKDPAAVFAMLAQPACPTLGVTANGALFLPGPSLAVPSVELPSYLHLIVDRSQENGYEGSIADALRLAHAKYPAARTARITVANYESVDVVADLTPINDLLTRAYMPLDQVLSKRGGLAVDLAVSRILRRHLEADLDHATDHDLPARPIIVIIDQHASRHANEMPLSLAWAEGSTDFELDELDATGEFVKLHAAHPAATPVLRLGDSLRAMSPNQAARFARPSAPTKLRYWSAANRTWVNVDGVISVPDQTPWIEAADLCFAQQDFDRSPGTSEIGASGLIKASRAQGTLIRSASYIAVENSAQWKQLAASEASKLNQNAALEFRETPAPSFIWLVGAYVAWLIVSRVRIQTKRGLIRTAG